MSADGGENTPHKTSPANRVDGAGRVDQRDLRARCTIVDRTLQEIDIVAALADAPVAYAIADRLPGPLQTGRPRHYPGWVSVLHLMLAGVLGSNSAASRVMSNPRYWRLIRRSASGNGADHARRRPPMSWHHDYAKRDLDRHISDLRSGMCADARRLARELGCLDPKALFSCSDPVRGQFLNGDGTVVKSPVRQSTVDKWRENGGRRVHAHTEFQNGEQGKETAYGTKFALLHTRPDALRNNRVVLDVAAVPHGKGYGGEAAVALKMVAELLDDAELRIDGMCYDGALNGVHIDTLMKRGLVVLSPIRKQPSRPLDLVDCPCGDRHELVLSQGTLYERIILDTGEKHLTECPRHKIKRRSNADGSFRWYVDFAIPSCGTLHSQRIDTSSIDRHRELNRSHHLRQHVPTDDGDGTYDRCYGWREDAESFNNTLDRSLYGGRMIAYSQIRQWTVMLGVAAGRNAIARWLHRRRDGVLQAGAA